MISAMGWAALWAGAWFGAVGGITALAALWLLVPAVAAFAYRPPESEPRAGLRVAVLVPAHDEVALIGTCIASLRHQDYPADLTSLIVIADNCTDATAQRARQAGADVMVRADAGLRGKGHALRWAMDRLMAGAHPPDAFVVVDADSVADRGLLSALVARHEEGESVVQAEYLVADDPSPRVRLRAAAFMLFHSARFAGRSVLGLPCSLVGNGMLFGADLIGSHPWDAFSGAEDLEYSVRLRLAGVRPAFTAAGQVRGPVPGSRRVAQTQRERWEGGRLHVAKTFLPRIARDVVSGRRISLADVALDLLLPPLGLLATTSAGGTFVVGLLWLAGWLPYWCVVPWLVSAATLIGYVLLGLRAAHAPPELYRSLLSAPRFMVEKVVGTAGVLRSRPTETWVRTERPNESG